ncbi:hypothetical protein [Brevundimonas sp.]|uniref:hypothetical protein n=1 Tax=Brevundimonas sp. TaxID=1871086 RepID=UPI001A2EDC7F|nr:hypothetical protein [Brevundimonas sp.]MBJ7485446.1 hypothetical protein [Brevundimonas sp.]
MRATVRTISVVGAVITAALVATSASSQIDQQAARPEYAEPRVYSAAEAVRDVNEAGPSGLPGQFAFVVKGGGRDGERVFLNSALDYRDVDTLTVALSGPVASSVANQLEGPPERRLIGRTIVVNGVARRVRINVLANGQPTGQFYFQTHVTVVHADQIFVVPGAALPLTVSR